MNTTEQLEIIQRACYELLKGGHEALMKELWNVGTAIEQRQQKPEAPENNK